jgi:hypothetical protein
MAVDKTVLIVGGVGVGAVILFMLLKANSTQAAQQNAIAIQPSGIGSDLGDALSSIGGIFSGVASGGLSSLGLGGGSSNEPGLTDTSDDDANDPGLNDDGSNDPGLNDGDDDDDDDEADF